MKNILFITGKLAEKGLRTVIESIEKKDFTYEIRNLNVNVAALLTTDMIERRIGNIDSFDEIIIPGRVRGDLESLKENINKKIIRGPDELKDLPTLFGASPVKYDLSKFETSIFGEITMINLQPSRDVFITCAVTGAGDTTAKSDKIPITPQQIADSCIGAAQAGAAVVHIHVRDPKTGAPGRDPALYAEVVNFIRESKVDMVLNLTSGMGGDMVFGSAEKPLPLNDK